MRFSEKREAKWLPSRCAFAFFRLAMLLHLAGRTPTAAREDDSTTTYVVDDRHQSSLENYWLGVLFFAFATSFVYVVIGTLHPLRLGYAIALFPIVAVLVPMVIEGILHVDGGILAIARRLGMRKSEIDHAVQSRMLIAAFTCAAAAGVVRGGASRAIGIAWFGVLLINAASAIILWLLRHRVTEAEIRFGGSPSAD
jgi:hypothetical protein